MRLVEQLHRPDFRAPADVRHDLMPSFEFTGRLIPRQVVEIDHSQVLDIVRHADRRA